MKKDGENKTLVKRFVEDFEVQNWQLTEKTKRELSNKGGALFSRYFFDMIFAHIVIGPAVVSFWRGTWDYSNHYLDQELCGGDLVISNSLSLSLGLMVTFTIDLTASQLQDLAGEKGTVSHSVARHLFSLVWGLGDIFYWKGVWDGVDSVAGKGFQQAGVTAGLGLTVLTVCRALKSGWSAPIGVMVDEPDDQISSSTLLSTLPSSPLPLRLLDSLMTRLVEVAVILAWHGIWSATDQVSEKMLNLNHRQTAWLSLFIGWTGGLVLFFTQFLILRMADINSRYRIIQALLYLVRFLFNLSGVYVTINSFRALWYLMDEFYLPPPTWDEVPVSSYLTGQVIGVLILMLLRCGSCLHAGIYRDSPSLGSTITFHYTSYFYIREVEAEHRDQLNRDTIDQLNRDHLKRDTCEQLSLKPMRPEMENGNHLVLPSRL